MKDQIEPDASLSMQWLSGGGEMGERIRMFNWAGTPIGPPERWSLALRTTVNIMLSNRFPLLLWWGPQYIQLYNDAYRPIPGIKHPHKALGCSVKECWSEIWHVLQPLIDTPFHGGPATWMEDILLEINRYGFTEETHFTIAYSPVPDETAPNGIGGVLATVHEITEKVIGERRIAALRDLGAGAGRAKTAEEACAIVAKTLAGHDKDVPFILLYLIDSEGKRAHLAGAAGVEMGRDISPPVVDLSEGQTGGWPLAEAMRSEAIQMVERFADRFETVPSGPWSAPPDTAVVIPVASTKAHAPAGLMVIGVSARLKFDEWYRDFLELMRTQVATAIASARAYEEEKKRAEALAEIDRAKTAFFSNVSHEFRTPLTLMLGPIEDILSDRTHPLPPEHREGLEVAHRNNIRLTKLVNTLLDFSRIEAGRAHAVYRPTDLAIFTAELASNFRSACERAGLKLIVDCPPLSEPVYVDLDMWEKIVLNLLSNAFKFTFEGEIYVTLQHAGDSVKLSVRDTGTGIPEEEIPHLFSRFHRVKDARSRTHEGTGIGLALVQELVKLHGGSMRVDSVFGRGSTFTVSVRMGKAHLPADRIGSIHTVPPTTRGGGPYVEEALRWLTDQPEPEHSDLPSGENGEAKRPLSPGEENTPLSDRPHILLAEDNGDMRGYILRLLGSRYEVEVVSNGKTALNSIRRRRPDLVLTDVMMPEMDGFGLLRELRLNPETRTIPIIMLSARAGEECRNEGMETGADDYLIKPFSSRELMTRVNSHLQMARVRKQAEEEISQANKMESIGILAGGIAHDFNNILTAIIGNLSLGKIYLDPEHRAFGRMDESQKVALRAQALTQQLLTFSVGGTPVKKPVHIGQLLKNWVGFLLQGSNVRFELSIPNILWAVEADEGQINQVINNLIINAQQSMPEGGRIRIEAQNIVVRLEDHLPLSAGDYVRIRVKDDGTGISHENLTKIFDPFFTSKPNGSGLGLTTSYWIVKRHLGHISVNSKPGKGSTFTIHLPKSKALIPMTMPAWEALIPGQGRILFMDDEPGIREFAAVLLNQLGYKAECAQDGLEAIELFQEAHESGDPFAAVILDLTIRGGMGGKETIKRLREIDRDVKAIVSSGYSNDPVLANFNRYGFLERISKPYTVESLSRILADVIKNQTPKEKNA